MLSADQLAARRHSIGASEVAGILGLSAFDGPMEVWERKVGIRPESEANFAMLVGTVFEAGIADIYSHCSGAELLHGRDLPDNPELYEHVLDGMGVRTDTIRSRFHPALTCTIDRFDPVANRIVEIKCVSASSAGKYWGEFGTGKFPSYYGVQCEFQMALTGIHQARLFAFGLNKKLYYHDIPYNEHRAVWIIQRVLDFWARVEAKEPDPNWQYLARVPWYKPEPLPVIIP